MTRCLHDENVDEDDDDDEGSGRLDEGRAAGPRQYLLFEAPFVFCDVFLP